VDAARAAEFAREPGSTRASTARLRAIRRWLTAPAIHDAIAQICAQADSVPVHESQHFTYQAPLRVGVDYDLSSRCGRGQPPRLVVEAALATLDGAPVGASKPAAARAARGVAPDQGL